MITFVIRNLEPVKVLFLKTNQSKSIDNFDFPNKKIISRTHFGAPRKINNRRETGKQFPCFPIFNNSCFPVSLFPFENRKCCFPVSLFPGNRETGKRNRETGKQGNKNLEHWLAPFRGNAIAPVPLATSGKTFLNAPFDSKKPSTIFKIINLWLQLLSRVN